MRFRALPSLLTAFALLGRASARTLFAGFTGAPTGCNTTAAAQTATYGVSVPPGVYATFPYATGDSAQCQAWKLSATVCNTSFALNGFSTGYRCNALGGFVDTSYGNNLTALSGTSGFMCFADGGECTAFGLTLVLSGIWFSNPSSWNQALVATQPPPNPPPPRPPPSPPLPPPP